MSFYVIVEDPKAVVKANGEPSITTHRIYFDLQKGEVLGHENLTAGGLTRDEVPMLVQLMSTLPVGSYRHLSWKRE